jgi:phenylpropionate dioxygenase-like ring-hydroxylating dioxygenase large terminal subunit
VNGPRAKLDGNKILVWFDNEVDRGQRPLRPNEMPEPQRPALLHFIFPNIWQNRLNEDSRIVVAFSPVDDENTVLYVRMYQRVVRVPILRELFNLISLLGNRVIVRQDRRVVVTQQPKRTELKMGERLFQADRPIVMYRRRREELMEGKMISP